MLFVKKKKKKKVRHKFDVWTRHQTGALRSRCPLDVWASVQTGVLCD
jgi:hypothetical protein